LGFFALDRRISPGNYGLLDQVAALDWVNDKISEFGGSKDDISIMGHGAGAISVSLHVVSPKSKGKFKRAIAMSGSAFGDAVKSIPDMQDYKDVKPSDCEDSKTNEDFTTCLRNLKVFYLVEHSWNKYAWGPVVDSYDGFLPKKPEEFFEAAEYHKVCEINFSGTYIGHTCYYTILYGRDIWNKGFYLLLCTFEVIPTIISC
jgi:carboxylesterase type B